MPDCLPLLAMEFKLSSEELDELLPSGKQTVLANRAHWARQYLSQAGLIEPIKRGSYRITAHGDALLKSHPTAISNETLRKYPKFLSFLAKSSKKDGQEVGAGLVATEELNSETPEIRIEKAHAQLDAILVQDLLEQVQSMKPVHFEQLILDLLRAMKYGGGDLSNAQMTKTTGDGGIDGIINEDALGLDAVYVQAKRYAPDSKVGRPALQAFVGSLTGEGATKGVFVTTSDFSKEAKDYLNKVQHRIVLINGDRLARLMIQHEVGVRARKTYVLRSVDEDYFSEV